MEKQEFKSRWDELAQQLGAEVSPEIQQREEAAANATPEAAATPPASPMEASAVRSAPPKRAAVDWDNLAGELGLAPAEPAPRAIEPEPQKASREEPAHSQPPERSQPERHQRKNRPGRRGESSRPGRQRVTTWEESREVDQIVAADIEADVMRPIEPAAAPPEAPREEPDRPSAAVSLWHKIFGSPIEQSAKITEIAAGTRDATEPLEDRDEAPLAGETTEIRSLSGEDVTAAAFVDELNREQASELDVDDDASTERRRGRSRRRRRGRGRKSEPRHAEQRQPGGDADRVGHLDDESDFDDDLRDLGSDDDQDGTGDVRELDRDAEFSEIEDGAANSHQSKAAQRTIPSWDEAIGFIVDSNLQSRSQRRAASRAESRGGSSRGRSRSRRNK